MAIADSPLFSLGARKTLGKTLTYLRIKGQNVVRHRVIPANPQTAAQQAQRGTLATVVGEWHTLPYTADDRAALNRWATASFRKLSGYNLHTRSRIDFLNAGGAINPPTQINVTSLGVDSADVDIVFPSGDSANLKWGVSRTAQPSTDVFVDETGDVYVAQMTDLVVGNTYYFYVEYTDDSETVTARGGLYKWVHVTP